MIVWALTALGAAASIAAAASAAQRTEQRADRTAGVAHAIYLARAGTQWAQAGIAAGPHSPRGRRWLAHAIVLDERVQDDPMAPPDLRRRAGLNEARAKRALFGASPNR